MDERELHELLRGAAENVQPSPDLPDRAERRYYRRRVRGRVLAAAVVVVIVGAGISVAATIGGDRSARGAGPRGVTTTTTPSVSDTVDVGNIGALSFLDANEGYGIEWAASGGDRYLVHTFDGARTWQRRGLMPEGVTSVLLAPEYAKGLDSMVAWGGGRLSQSSDGGAHWQPTLGPSVSAVTEASFRLWATVVCGPDGPSLCTPRLATSTDGGRTWTDPEKPVDLRRGAEGLANPSGNSVYLVDGEFAWTPDGGRSWARHPEPEACATRTTQRLAVSVTTLLLVCSSTTRPGEGSRAFVSMDQGRTWQSTAPLPSRVTNYSALVTATDSGFLVAIGNGPLLTTDAGQSWHHAFPIPANGAVVAVSRTFGVGYWAAAADHGIWFSADGRRWERRSPAAPVPRPFGCFKVSKSEATKPGFVQCAATVPGDIPPRYRALINLDRRHGLLPYAPK